MKRFRNSIFVAAALTVASFGADVSAGEAMQAGRTQLDIVDTAVASDDFSTLVAAVKAAGLVDALKGDGPFTVFAPTDAAFAKLPKGTLESLLQPENKDRLAAILTYHVVPGKVMSGDVKPGKVATLQGQMVTLAAKKGGLTIDGANIVAADIATSNGVIHVIDSVILPK